jgi:hypothetical protein
MKKNRWSYSPHYRETSQGHLYIKKEGACTIQLEGAYAMSQEELDKFGKLIVDSVNYALDNKIEFI